MAVTRETDGDAAALHHDGWRSFETGVAFDARRGADWCQGWLAAAADARQRLAASAGLLDHREAILAAMHQAYAAFRSVEGRSKLLPSDRSRMNSAAVKIGAALPYVEGTAAKAPGRRRT